MQAELFSKEYTRILPIPLCETPESFQQRQKKEELKDKQKKREEQEKQEQQHLLQEQEKQEQ